MSLMADTKTRRRMSVDFNMHSLHSDRGLSWSVNMMYHHQKLSNLLSHLQLNISTTSIGNLYRVNSIEECISLKNEQVNETPVS